ncbi:hypothetical protein IKE67_03885 [bacterium]|nr:hypothetical protein [bacterium]
MTTIIGIGIENRKEIAAKVQEILTEFGCDIKTRLGLNDYKETECSYKGLILLDVPNREQAVLLENKLKEISSVIIKEMEF